MYVEINRRNKEILRHARRQVKVINLTWGTQALQ